MKVSRNWLQDYFTDPLPQAEDLVRELTFHSFETEGVKKVGSDTVIDLDVLPNRASDCLSHRGIAKELSVLLARPLARDPLAREPEWFSDSEKLSVQIEEGKLCDRFSAVVMEGVSVGPSPSWLKERLEAIGQKSINNVVDATNYVMFNLGQPLHAFDRAAFAKNADNRYRILVRRAQKGEGIAALTGESYTLSDKDLVIADGVSGTLLGLAGIKGGKYAEVNAQTVNLVIEAAHFDYAHVRQTSKCLKLSTDASTRFQNNPSPALTRYALAEVAVLIKKVAGGEVEGAVDIYKGRAQTPAIAISRSRINAFLGSSLTEREIEDILLRFGWAYTKEGDTYTVTTSFERKDLVIPEDLIEEIGRVYGYEKIKPVPLVRPNSNPGVNKRYAYIEKARHFLVERGYSEVYTYALRDEGDVEIANPFASDKAFLRSNLRDGIMESLKLNRANGPLLSLDAIRIFEIGTVFEKDSEHVNLALGALDVKTSKGKDSEVSDTLSALWEMLGAPASSGRAQNGVIEAHFDVLIASLPKPDAYPPCPLLEDSKDVRFQPLSPYPFVLRDVALWVPVGVSSGDVEHVIYKTATDLLVKLSLFDVYEKDDRVSYAFRLVFQSQEKTLTDSEVNEIMEVITSSVSRQKNWVVR